MVNIKFLVFMTLFAVFLTNCAPQAMTPAPPPITTEEPGIPVTSVAVVQSVEIQILGSKPVQVNAILRGQLPDAGCTTISSVSQARTGNTFNLTLNTKTDPLARCAQMLTPFEHVIPLEVSSLLAGSYIVSVNRVQGSFELPESVLSTDVQYVMAQQDISIYSGPGSQNSVLGFVASGQIAKVTGVSANGGWWRVICPDDTIGSCWVPTDPSHTSNKFTRIRDFYQTDYRREKP